MTKAFLSFCNRAKLFSKVLETRCIPASHVVARRGTFEAPTRPNLKPVDVEQTYAKGRDDPMLFSDEYVPPLVRPDWHRNKLKYRLERMDCLRRRKALNIPEFYPGSVVAVTYADRFAPGKSIRFVGRVLFRDGFGLGCKFALRNVLDGEGIEVHFHLFGPSIQKIEVMQLEKWIDTDLRYLRNADPSVCTFDPNMEAKAVPPTSVELPVFKGKVKMNKYKWQFQYGKSWPPPYNADTKSHFVEEQLTENKRFAAQFSWLKYDICRHYDITEMKEEIVNEMKANAERVNKADT